MKIKDRFTDRVVDVKLLSETPTHWRVEHKSGFRTSIAKARFNCIDLKIDVAAIKRRKAARLC